MPEPEHLSCRNVAEYAYCPRLFYYMAVEGVFVPSADTEQGCAVHHRTSKPSLASDEEAEEEQADDPDKPRSIRSFALTSERLGLTGVIDLAQLNGNIATPIEYRKGAPRHLPISLPPEPVEENDTPALTLAEPWPTDRGQESRTFRLPRIITRARGSGCCHLLPALWGTL